MANPGKEIHQNYLDTFYRCITESKMICHDMVEEHKLVYIMSGRLTLRSGNRRVDVKNGQAVFVRRNHLVREYKQPGENGEPFKGLFFHLNASDLRDMESRIEVPPVKIDEMLARELAIPLSPHPFLNLKSKSKRNFSLHSFVFFEAAGLKRLSAGMGLHKASAPPRR